MRFEFLHPPPGWEVARRNNQSCVLRVQTAGGTMLLTGDIERAAEDFLARSSSILRAEVLLVPHHGSRTSSSEAFIEAVAPRWAVVPAGYRNRFGHPTREVLARYEGAGAHVLRTDLGGAVNVILKQDFVEVGVQRALAPRYWRRSPPV